jgi:hypothetical protein
MRKILRISPEPFLVVQPETSASHKINCACADMAHNYEAEKTKHFKATNVFL